MNQYITLIRNFSFFIKPFYIYLIKSITQFMFIGHFEINI